MKSKTRLLFILFLASLLGGCAGNRMKPAEKFIEQKQYEKALREYMRMLNPRLKGGKRIIDYDPDVIIGIGSAYWHMQRYSTAERVLQLVLNKQPDNGKALFYLGLTKEEQGDEDGAIRVYRKYDVVRSGDPFRQVLKGRLDWMNQKKVTREVQLALQNEGNLTIEGIPDNSVAVLYFLNLSENSRWLPLQKGLAEMMITDLARVESLKVIERLRIQQLMDELRMTDSGIMEDQSTARWGKLMGARYLVKGSYTIMPDMRMSMFSGIYSVEDFLNPVSQNLDGNLSRLFQMEKRLVLYILENFGITLDPHVREKILEVPTQNMEAFLAYCNGLDVLDAGDFQKARMHFVRAVELDPRFELAKDYLMLQSMWDITHATNTVRVNRDITQLLQTLPSTEYFYMPPPELVSTWNRIQTLNAYQTGTFLPGNDSRKTYSEADLKGAPVIPERLGEPPRPPVTY